MAGTIIHDALELILNLVKKSGCSSLFDEAAVRALREHGGYSKILESTVHDTLESLRNNPRMAASIDHLRTRLERRAPELRSSIQKLVARTPSVSPNPFSTANPLTRVVKDRKALGPGAHPEASLIATDGTRFAGRLDLLTVDSEGRAEIVDYKTGEPKPHHPEQVTLYGFLWSADSIANPQQLPVTNLTIAYLGQEKYVPVPTNWAESREHLREWIEDAEAVLNTAAPAAIPSDECFHCPVRHMCDEYWAVKDSLPPSASTFVDAEVMIAQRHGPKSWTVSIKNREGKALLRTTSETDSFQPGQSLRLLDVVSAPGDDDAWTVLTQTISSEIFPGVGLPISL